MPKSRRSKLTRRQKADLKYSFTAKRANAIIKRQRKHLLIMATLLLVSLILNALQTILGV